jgi:hypothetical protein
MNDIRRIPKTAGPVRVALKLRTSAAFITAAVMFTGLAEPSDAATGKKKSVRSTTVPPKSSAVPAPLTLQQTGTYVSDSSVPFAKGTIVATLTHEGSSNFQVHLIDPSTGKKEVFLANEIGAWSGQVAAEIRANRSYLVSVVADGSWTLRIEHPRPTSGTRLPKLFSGTGSVVLAPVQHSGGARFTMTHEGSSNFQVGGFTPGSGKTLFIANEIGGWSGVTVKPMQGVTILAIVADGAWTVRVDPT